MALLTVYLAFNAGGFFPGATANAALVLCLLLVLAIMLVGRPFESLTPGLLVPLGLLTAFAAWTLCSALWGTAGRALLGFDRVLLYVLVFAFFGILAPGKRRLEWGLRGFAVAAVVVCAAGWVTRVAADLWPIALDVQPERLSFPLTYWNALGLLATLGILACLHLSSGERESRPVRVLGAAAVPLLASVLLLTFSRASLALAVIGIVLYAVVARPPRLLAVVGAVAVPSVVALIASYRADLVGSAGFASPPAVSQGHHLALIVLACVIVAGGLRWALAGRSDPLLDDWIPPVFEPRTVALVVAGGVALLLAIAVAIGAPGWLGSRYDSFLHGNDVGYHANPRARLTAAGNNGRIPEWEVALDAFGEAPLLGSGAGTYQLQWAQRRPFLFTVINAHSLYAGALGELGIVGLLLIAGVVVSILAGLARRLRGPDRHLYGALIALTAVWALHAGVDWDWEMPAITVWVFALAGLALARPAAAGEATRPAFVPGRLLRIVAAVGIGVLAVTPVAITVSQAHLDDAVAAFRRSECELAIRSSLDSLEALKVRPEPYELIGYCDARRGQYALAEREMEAAVSRDPNNWETHYGLAIVRAAAGRDPVPELEASRRLNPREPLIAAALRAMRGAGPREWRQRAAEATLPT